VSRDVEDQRLPGGGGGETSVGFVIDGRVSASLIRVAARAEVCALAGIADSEAPRLATVKAGARGKFLICAHACNGTLAEVWSDVGNARGPAARAQRERTGPRGGARYEKTRFRGTGRAAGEKGRPASAMPRRASSAACRVENTAPTGFEGDRREGGWI